MITRYRPAIAARVPKPVFFWAARLGPARKARDGLGFYKGDLTWSSMLLLRKVRKHIKRSRLERLQAAEAAMAGRTTILVALSSSSSSSTLPSSGAGGFPPGVPSPAGLATPGTITLQRNKRAMKPKKAVFWAFVSAREHVYIFTCL